MRSCATRRPKRKGPAQTGFSATRAPAACTAFGDSIIPARSDSTPSSGAKGCAMRKRTVSGSSTSTACTGRSSAARRDPGALR